MNPLRFVRRELRRRSPQWRAIEAIGRAAVVQAEDLIRLARLYEGLDRRIGALEDEAAAARLRAS